uniref:hypothetical protein n=1 Tax=Pigmentiphaga litoralis TaxID=516702 RepID=UPI00389B3967
MAYQGLIDFTMQFVDYGQHDYAPDSFVARVLATVRDDASSRLARRSGDADPQISQWAEDYFFDDSVFQAICESGRLDSSGIRAIRWLCTEGTEREVLRGDLPLEKQVESLWPVLEQVCPHRDRSVEHNVCASSNRCV